MRKLFKGGNYSRAETTLDSAIEVATGINVAPGTFGKNIKHSPLNRHPPYLQTEDILKTKYALPSLIRNVAPGKKSKN